MGIYNDPKHDYQAQDHHGRWLCCDNCGYPSPVAPVPPFPGFPSVENPVMLCELCMEGGFGKATTETHIGGRDIQLYRALAWAANHILRTLE